jgi:hypothetical protein
VAGGIFLIDQAGGLIEMTEQPYDSEDLLQELLATHPSLLPGGQIDRDSPRRWLLVTRESPVPDQQDGPGRWAVDHLFLDQDGIPTLVEVKRASDTRIRREVVGQMLDYAANAIAYWPVESIRAQFQTRASEENLDPVAAIDELTGHPGDDDAFWQQVSTNLQAGRVRLLFVADVIPPELRRIVEFLNTQMKPAEVLAIEVKQNVGAGQRVMVSTVIGQSERAKAGRSAGARPTREWDMDSFLTELTAKKGSDGAATASAIIEGAKLRGWDLSMGGGPVLGSIRVASLVAGASLPLFTLWTNGPLELQLQTMMNRPPFDDELMRLQLIQKLNDFLPIRLPAEAASKKPGIPLTALAGVGAAAAFCDVMGWAASEFQKVHTHS